MQSYSLVISLSVLLTSACAREALDDGAPAGDAPAGDATGEDARGAGQDAAQACSDGDGDGACDDSDNCPSAANPDQLDGDDDGQGDACDQPATFDCLAIESVPASVPGAGEATFSNVRANGATGTLMVRPGDNVRVALDYMLAACSSLVPEPRTLTFGIEGQTTGTCQTLFEFTCPLAVSADTSFSLNAPSERGAHYIVATGGHGITCSRSLGSAKRIAAICVQ